MNRSNSDPGVGNNENMAASHANSTLEKQHKPCTLKYEEHIQICFEVRTQEAERRSCIYVYTAFRKIRSRSDPRIGLLQHPKKRRVFFQRGATLFFAISMKASGSALEILTLYQQRLIVEKQSRYAMYHPSAEVLASMLTDMPYKITNAIVINAALYFLANLRREPGNFFIFLFAKFTLILTMSMKKAAGAAGMD